MEKVLASGDNEGKEETNMTSAELRSTQKDMDVGGSFLGGRIQSHRRFRRASHGALREPRIWCAGLKVPLQTKVHLPLFRPKN